MSTEQPAPYDIAKAVISEELAALAKKDAEGLYQKIIPSSEPLQLLDHSENSRTASNSFLKLKDKSGLARLLGVDNHIVKDRFRGSHLCILNKIEKEREQKSGRTDWVYSILALEDLSCSNGLPALGQASKEFELKAGDMLHFKGDLLQRWKGNKGGGRTLLWFYWSVLP